MKATAFDAVLDFPLPRGAGEVRAVAVFLGASARPADRLRVRRAAGGPVRPGPGLRSDGRPLERPLRAPDR
jgi:hypothetical protein